MQNAIEKINKTLDSNIKWAFFGGVAIAIYNNKFYRRNEDIDIIVENSEEKLEQLVPNLENCDRAGRKKRCVKIDDIHIEFMLMTGRNEIDLADGKFRFYQIITKKFNNILLPVIDLPSLYCAKLRFKESLKNSKNKKKQLKNSLKDIEIIKQILNN